MTYKTAVRKAEASGIPKENVAIEDVLTITSGTLIQPCDKVIKVKGGSVQNAGDDKSVLVIQQQDGGSLEWYYGESRLGQVYPNGTWVSYDRRASIFIPDPK